MVLSGAGIAAGPARFLSAYLAQVHGVRARYLPPSAFAESGQRPEAHTLVLFSQSISANAQMVLQQRAHYKHVTLVTATRPELKGTPSERLVASLLAEGLEIIFHEPKREDGMLVRVLGPSAAALQGVRWASGFGGQVELNHALAGLSTAVRAALDRATLLRESLSPERLLGDVAFVTCGGYGDACRGLAWKWMEGLWTKEPPLWDVLQAVHGPLQTFWERDTTLIALVDDSPISASLLKRLAGVLHPERHHLVTLKATMPGLLGMFEHGAALDQMMVWALGARPRDLGDWPAKGMDEPLYGLSAPLSLGETDSTS